VTIPVQVRRRTLPVCEQCAAPIRLHASLKSGWCCCCRHRCGLDVGLGCQVCGALLPDCDAEIGLCAGCRVIA
jgi:hypothetical protein